MNDINKKLQRLTHVYTLGKHGQAHFGTNA